MNHSIRPGERGIFNVFVFPFIIFAGVSALLVGTVVHQRYTEVSVQEYQRLAALADQSCSGLQYLKQAVATGPLLTGRAQEVRAVLRQRADAQAANDARTAILGSAGAKVCS